MADQNLKRTMGLTMATALVVGNMVGSGVFLLPASLAYVAGPVSIIGWVFTGVGAMLLALVFARLGPHLPAHRRSVRVLAARIRRLHRLPDRVGLLDRRVGRQRRDRGRVRRLPGRLLGRPRDRTTCSQRSSASRVIWLLTLVNIAGARETGAVQVVTTVLKFVPLAIIGVVGLFFIDGDNLTPFAPDGTWSAISAAAPLTLWAFIGLESATVAGRARSRTRSARSRARR